MAKLLTLQVLSPAEHLLDVPEVQWVQAWLVDGSIGIWPGHAPLLAETTCGPLRYADARGEHCLTVEAGILHVEEGRIRLLTGGSTETLESSYVRK